MRFDSPIGEPGRIDYKPAFPPSLAMSNEYNGNGLPTPTDGSSGIEQVRSDILKVVESLIEVGVMVHDYFGEPSTNKALESKVQAFHSDLQRVAADSAQLAETQVPLDILSYIDNGRNPDVYSREFVEVVVKQNQYINGKTRAMRQFKDRLIQDLSSAFPRWEPVFKGYEGDPPAAPDQATQ